jgi:putative lipoic acid-binding regulatory protein
LNEEETLKLLEAHHAFPGEYPLTVIALNNDAVTAAVLQAIEEGLGAPLADTAKEQRPSSGGKYLSHRLRVPCAAASDVIRLYTRVRRVDGVMTVL